MIKWIMCDVNIFKSIYIYKYMDSDYKEQCTACLRLLHISSFFTVLHQRLKISACNSHYFDPACALLDFERNDNTILGTAGREPSSSGSAFSQRRSFSGE